MPCFIKKCFADLFIIYLFNAVLIWTVQVSSKIMVSPGGFSYMSYDKCSEQERWPYRCRSPWVPLTGTNVHNCFSYLRLFCIVLDGDVLWWAVFGGTQPCEMGLPSSQPSSSNLEAAVGRYTEYVGSWLVPFAGANIKLGEIVHFNLNFDLLGSAFLWVVRLKVCNHRWCQQLRIALCT